MRKLYTNGKWIIVICGILVLCLFLLNWLNHKIYIISEANNITVKSYAYIWPPHDSHLTLFYKNKQLCYPLGGEDPKRYLLSPDSNLILYLYETPEGEKYGIYNIKENKTRESRGAIYLIGFNRKAEWLADKIMLSDDKQKDILDLKTGNLEIVRLKNK
jgi:hypothetical protein